MTNDEAIEMIRNDMKLHHDSLSGEYRKALRMAISALSQPQRMNGKWVQISPAKIYECSICGKNVMTEDIDAYDFCHGCGADMRGWEE